MLLEWIEPSSCSRELELLQYRSQTLRRLFVIALCSFLDGVLCRYPSDFLLCLREKKEKREEEEKRKREKKKKKIHKYKSQLSSSLPLPTYSALCFSPHLSTSSLAHIVLSHELVEFIYFLRMYEC